MKRLISLTSAVVLVFVLCVSISAVEPRIVRPTVTLTFDGTTACCKAVVTSTGSIDVTMTLKQGNTVLESWSKSGSTSVSLQGEHTVTKGGTYTLEVSGTANGTPFSATTSGKC